MHLILNYHEILDKWTICVESMLGYSQISYLQDMAVYVIEPSWTLLSQQCIVTSSRSILQNHSCTNTNRVSRFTTQDFNIHGLSLQHMIIEYSQRSKEILIDLMVFEIQI